MAPKKQADSTTKKTAVKRAPRKKKVANNPMASLPPNAFDRTPKVETMDVDKIREVIGESGITNKQVDILRKTVFNGFTAEQMGYAFHFAKAIGANIFAGDLKAYKDENGEVIHVIARDFLKNKAYENPKFSSYTTASVFANDEFEFDQGEGRVIKHHVKHAFDPEKRGACIGAYCIGRFSDGSTTSYLARMSKYKPENVGKTSSWTTDDEGMIIKCAEAPVLKKFAKLGNVYTSEEIAHVLEWQRVETSPDVSKLDSITHSDDEK